MYINFKFLTSSGLDIYQFVTLAAINQGENLFYSQRESILKYLTENGYIEQRKNGKYKLTDKGKGYMEAIEKPEGSKDVEILSLELYNMYREMGKNAGNLREAEDNLAWFCTNTNFSNEAIKETVKKYLDKSGEYTMQLPNLIWKSPNVFSVHKNLKNSKLFDEIVAEYKIKPGYFFIEKMDSIDNWLFTVSRMPTPPKADYDLYITGTRDGDKDGIKKIKKILFDRMQNM